MRIGIKEFARRIEGDHGAERRLFREHIFVISMVENIYSERGPATVRPAHHCYAIYGYEGQFCEVA